jgi:hypothetical protein
MKKEVDRLDATPSKRLFLSIIADYDLNRSICELVDNGLDVWVRGGKARDITIEIFLDKGQQTIEELLGDRPLTRVRKAVLTAVSKRLHAQARKDEARYNPLIAIQWGCVTHHASGSRL